MSSLSVIRTVAELRERVAAWRLAGESIGLVPTMGALHEGHMTLVEASKASCKRTVATLFVNPKQFGPNEDFAVYPRDEERDRSMLEEAGVDVLFAPGVDEMYPKGHSTKVDVGPLGEALEGLHRPGFFVGVATVVSKLLNQAHADRAFFGEKDFQQLQVITRLARDLDIPTAIKGVPTVREEYGLALSSRNAYLSEAEREVAPSLNRALQEIREAVLAGNNVATAIDDAAASLIEGGFASVDYLIAVRVSDFEPVASLDDLAGAPGRVLGAATLGRTRLIDNIAI